MSHCITAIETSNKILKNILEKKTITFGAGKKTYFNYHWNNYISR